MAAIAVAIKRKYFEDIKSLCTGLCFCATINIKSLVFDEHCSVQTGSKSLKYLEFSVQIKYVTI